MNIHLGKHIVVGCSGLSLSACDQALIRQVQPVGLLLHPGLVSGPITPLATPHAQTPLRKQVRSLIEEFRKLVIAPRFLLVADLATSNQEDPNPPADWLTQLLDLERLDPDANLILMGDDLQLAPFRALMEKLAPQQPSILLAPRCFTGPEGESSSEGEALHAVDALLEAKPEALSLGAQYYAALDTLYPAPFSEILVQQALRSERNFQGLILCESVELPLASELYNTPFGIFRSLAVGVDLFIVPRTQASADSAWVDPWLLGLNQRLPEAFDNLKISRQQLAQAGMRIDAVLRTAPLERGVACARPAAVPAFA